MKLKTSKQDLVKNIQNVQNIISARTSLPILSNILIEAEPGGVKLTATDLDVGISSTFNVDVQEEGSISVPAKKFSDIVKELPDEDILINALKNNSLSIRCSKSFFKVMGLPKEDFPKLPEFKDEPQAIIPEATLKKMLSMTHFSMSHDETRYILNGALFLFKDGKFIIAATDGKRLSVAKEALETALTNKATIIPSKTIYELHRSLQEEGDVKMIFGENQVKFELHNITIISRLIEGEFPNYEQVIPKEAQEKININREAFLLGVKRASLFTTQDSHSIKMDVLKNRIIISKSNPTLGEAKEEIDCSYSGKEMTVGFNPSYLLDVLKVIPKDELEVEMSGPDQPAVVRMGDWYLYLVLPIQLA